MKKKVLFINNHFQYSDGTVTALIGLCNNLNPIKYDITILPLYRCDLMRVRELREGITIKRGFGFYFQGMAKLLNLIPLPILYKHFVNYKYDIEVAFQCDLPTRIVGHSLNKKAAHIIWMHGWDFWKDEFESADKVVCVSRTNEEKCRDILEVQGNVTHCYNIIDNISISKMSSEPVELLPPERPRFISVGRLSPEKGYSRLVRILSELRYEGYIFSLIIVGGGDEMESIKAEIAKTNMEDYITMTGIQSNPHKFTAKADCFICSSFSEGYSTACTEAAILGIPIISTNVPGGKEIIDDCECGILTEIDDESLKVGIRQILQNPSILIEWKSKMSKTKVKFSLSERSKAVNLLFEEISQVVEKKNHNCRVCELSSLQNN